MIFCCVCRFEFNSTGNTKFSNAEFIREFTHYVSEIGDHPTAMTCLPMFSSGKFQVNKVRFSLSNG